MKDTSTINRLRFANSLGWPLKPASPCLPGLRESGKLPGLCGALTLALAVLIAPSHAIAQESDTADPAGTVSNQLADGSLKVTWMPFDKYRDFAADSIAGQKNTRSGLERIMAELTEQYIPENHTLSLKITSVDLAGYYSYAIPSDVRIVREHDPAFFEAAYEVRSATGTVVASGVASGSSFGRLNFPALRMNRHYSREELALEELFREIEEALGPAA